MIGHKSPRAKRLERRNRRQAGQNKLNLVSLMDIFTILVFFLLVNSAAVEVLPNPKHLELPESVAEERARETLVLMITKDEILVAGKPVMSLEQARATETRLLGPLKSELLLAPLLPVEGQRGKLTRGEINIMADKGIPYSVIKKVMATASDARFARISLAVIQTPDAGGDPA